MHIRRYIPVILAMTLICAALAFGSDTASQGTGTQVAAHPKTKKAKSHHVASHPVTHHVASHPATPHHSAAHHGAKVKKTKHSRGQQAIDSERVTEIQEALVREHYLKGEPSGNWDDATQAAMRRYQGDQGWQNKLVPDSRALIRLGLGPDHEHLLNPESAMTTETPVARNTGKPVHASSGMTSTAVSAASSDSSLQASPTASTNIGTMPDLTPSR